MHKSLGLCAVAALILFSLGTCEQPILTSADAMARFGPGAGAYSPTADPEAHFYFLPPLARGHRHLRLRAGTRGAGQRR